MKPAVYPLGATVLVTADRADANDIYVEGAVGSPVELLPVEPGQALAGLNMIRGGDFAGQTSLWQPTGAAGVEVGADIGPEWTLDKGHTGYARLAPGMAAGGAVYADPVHGDLLPVLGGQDYLFGGQLAAHRCMPVLRAEFFDADRQPLHTFAEGVIDAGTGGSAVADYSFAHLHAFSPAAARFVRLSIVCEPRAAAEDDAYLFFTLLSFGLSAGKLARGWVDTPCDLMALVADLHRPSAGLFGPDRPLVRKGEAQVTVHRRGEPVSDPVGLRARPIKCRWMVVRGRRFSAEIDHVDDGNLGQEYGDIGTPTRLGVCVYIDGRLDTIGFAHKTEKPSRRAVHLRLTADFFDGAGHRVEFRTFEGQLLGQDVEVLAPYSIDYEVVRAHTRPPYRSELSPLSGTRFRSLQAQMERADELGADGIAQIGRCLDALSVGFEHNKTFAPLVFPALDMPQVSVVVPVHNKFAVTYNCLASLLFAYNKATFEVIVVDDGSSDRTLGLADLVSGIRIVRHDTARGFVGACNAGAAAARGQHIVLLNNDTEVTYRWLDELLFAFSQFDRVGLVGSKLVYPNGTLQEAGGIIWGEGLGWNYGRHCNPHEPQYNYTRPVHYCSGAAIMVAADVWREVGGFSEEFAPAYYEDTDLAFQIRKVGYRTLCAPLSEVVHFEGISNGTEVASGGMKRFQEINRPKFAAKWATELEGAPEPGPAAHTYKDQGVTRRALFIDYQLPRTDFDAGSYAAIQEMRLMQSLGYKVTFLPGNLAWLGKYVEQLQRIGVEVVYAPFFASVDEFLQERGREFDVVYITRYYVAQDNLDFVREYAPQAKVLFNNADLHFLREARAAIQAGDPEALAEARRTRDEELAVMRLVDLNLSYNEVEHAVILSHNMEQSRVAKAPWVVDTSADVPAFADREGIAFLGGYGHPPNVEAVQYFVRQVMPALRSSLPGVRFYIYGSRVGPEVQALAADDIIVVGHVDDVAEVYERHRLFVAPLLSGAGIKGKVLAAMAHGIPSVLSPIAAEGTGVRDRYDCRIAATVAEWADVLTGLYDNEAEWQRLSGRARDFIAGNYSFDRARQDMVRALDTVGAGYDPEPTGLYIRTSSVNLDL